MDRRAAEREERAARQRDVLVGDDASLLLVEVVRRARADLRLGQPRHAERRDALLRDEDVGALDDAPRIDCARGDVRGGEAERDDAQHEAETLRAAHDAVDAEAPRACA